MGWNSWDFYGTSINEGCAKAQADYQAAHLLPYGWNLFTVDIQWYEPNASGFSYTAGAALAMDDWGRLTPATNRFPSATNGAGFKPLADYVHGKGLKFGIHLMRGIPRQAAAQATPVKGTTNTAADIADTLSTCGWNSDMYGVNMARAGAQAYYDSVLELVASWGVDFIKVDDLSYPYHAREIEALRKAIDKCGRNIVLSTSPGATPVGMGNHVMQNANQWRISDDFWDTWSALYEQFQRLHNWTPYRGAGYFPDADMLPLGMISGGSPGATGRQTYFTTNEQVTLMSLWAIARSPLIHGGDLTQMDSFTLTLLTNTDVIAVSQYSTHNRQLYRTNDLVAWICDSEFGTNRVLGLFNASNSSATLSVSLTGLGFTGGCTVRSLWDRKEQGSVTGNFSAQLAAHRGNLYRLSGSFLPTPWLASAVGRSNRVELAWEPLAGTAAYRVKRSLTETGTYQTIATGLTNTAYTDATAQNGTTYYYAVSALFSGKESPDSGPRSATALSSPGTISWNYDRYGTVASTALAGVVAATNWNNSWPNNPLNDLADSSGAATSLTISYSSVNTWSIQSSDPGADGDGTSNKRLLNGYLNAGLASWSPPVTASSVLLGDIPQSYYDLIVYFSSDVEGRAGFVTDGRTTNYFSTLGPASLSSANAAFARTTQNTADAYPSANYAIFQGLSGSSQTVAVQMRDQDAWGGLAGFQLVPQPDPLPHAPLAIQPGNTNGSVRVAWPLGLGTVVLQNSSDLSSWSALDPQPVTNFTLISASAQCQFFRLSRP
jgi:hypothetical protein